MKNLLSSQHLFAISLLISLTIFSTVTKASEQILATISTDVNSDHYQFVVEVDQEARMLKAFYIDNFIVGENRSRDALPIESFLNEGIILPKNGNRVFATINAQNFDRGLGGVIIINALYNAVTGKRKSYEFDLAQDQSGWKLFYKGKAISKIRAIAHKLPLVGVVGAKELSME